MTMQDARPGRRLAAARMWLAGAAGRPLVTAVPVPEGRGE